MQSDDFSFCDACEFAKLKDVLIPLVTKELYMVLGWMYGVHQDFPQLLDLAGL